MEVSASKLASLETFFAEVLTATSSWTTTIFKRYSSSFSIRIERFRPEDLRNTNGGEGGGNKVDKDDDSESENEERVDRNRVPSGYSHEWLMHFSEQVGAANIPDEFTEVDLFRLFITDDIINLLVVETNRYAEQVKEVLELHAFEIR